MDFIEQKKQFRRVEQDRQQGEYLRLVRKAALSKLTPTEDRQLDDLSDSLGHNLETIEAHAAAIKREAELIPIADTRAKHAAELQAAEKDATAFRAKELKVMTELDVDRRNLNERFAKINAMIARADRAVEQLTELRQANWRALGMPDPSTATRHRHLIQVILGRPANTAVEVVEFESVMVVPSQWAAMFSDLRVEWIPAAGQTEAQLDTLLNIARSLIRDGKTAKYLTSTTDAREPKAFASALHVVDMKQIRPITQDNSGFDTSMHRWLALPGTPQADIDGMIQTIDKKQVRPGPAMAAASSAGGSTIQ